MNKMEYKPLVLLGALTLLMLMASLALANGGPFLIKYPNGDPAAKGILARLDPDLKPARETRLRVIKEDLKVTFSKGWRHSQDQTEPPVADVSAQYVIENPTNSQIEIDFGFPILRGIYIEPFEMGEMTSAVNVRLDDKRVPFSTISSSGIYGITRQRTREVIEKNLSANNTLANLVAAVHDAQPDTSRAARRALSQYLVDSLKWNERDAALMLEYASLDLDKQTRAPRDRSPWHQGDNHLNKLMNANLGPLYAIGEQKATQFFAQLAARFDPQAAATYESIFTAWGGDVRERSVDLKTGTVRPREITVDTAALNDFSSRISDPTIYARVDYLDPKAKISESEKESCKAILKSLPVIFTFAPMNILHYRITFPAISTQTLTVSYRQYAYSDTHAPSSYQLAYVVHPASFWNDFGPINLEVAVPRGVPFRASIPCLNNGVEERQIYPHSSEEKVPCEIYRAELKQKTGEIYLAVDAEAWKSGGQKVAANRPNERLQQVAR
ncbi:MAG TPA: hypothetical protein VMX13_06245 [Sedimentisphaerales bacterium]|nr:hypothetical protein [Sedimentisphaerales bacterium]